MSGPLRVLMVAPDFKPKPGGIAEYVHQMARHLKDLGDEPVVLAPPANSRAALEYDVREYEDSIVPYRGRRWNLPGRYLVHRENVRRRVRTIEQMSPDVVWLTAALYGYQGYFWGKACRLHGMPYIITCHGSDARWLARDGADHRNQAIVRGAARVLTVSQHVKHNLETARLTTERATVVHNGVSLDVLQRRTSRRDLPVELRDARIVLCACRFFPWKRLDMLVRVFARVLAQVPSARLALCGDGPEKENIVKTIREEGVQDKVLLPGYVTGKPKWAFFEHAEVYAMTGHGEGFGIPFVEAAAKGKPCVVTAGDGASEAVLHESTGLVVPADSVEAVAEAIVRIMRDCELARRLGEAGRRRVAEELNWPAIAQKAHHIMQEVVDGRDR